MQRNTYNYYFLILADGSSKYLPEAGRYHLYVSLACPWANRTLILRKLKGLEKIITVDVVEWLLTEKGWSFNPEVYITVINVCAKLEMSVI